MPSPKRRQYSTSEIADKLAPALNRAFQRKQQAQQPQGQGLPNYYDLKEAMANAPKQEPPDEGLAGFGEYVGKAWLGGGLTGTLSELITGEPVFDEPSTYQPNKVEEFIGGAAEFASPADLLAMFLGAGVGGKIAGAAIKEGASAALGKVATSALKSGGGFAAQSGAREAAESKLETGSVDIPGTLLATAKGGAIGVVAGAAGTAAGLPFAKSKLQTFAETAGEIAGFGTAVPVIEEGRSPEVNDYLQAGYAIAAFKLATFPLNRRKAVADKVIAEESEYVRSEVAKGRSLDEVFENRLSEVTNRQFSSENMNRLLSSTDGDIKVNRFTPEESGAAFKTAKTEDVLRVRDIATGKAIQKELADVLDFPIQIDNSLGEVAAKFDPNTNSIRVSNQGVSRGGLLRNLLEEVGHAKRSAKGRGFTEVDPTKITAEEYLRLPEEQNARKYVEHLSRLKEPNEVTKREIASDATTRQKTGEVSVGKRYSIPERTPLQEDFDVLEATQRPPIETLPPLIKREVAGKRTSKFSSSENYPDGQKIADQLNTVQQYGYLSDIEAMNLSPKALEDMATRLKAETVRARVEQRVQRRKETQAAEAKAKAQKQVSVPSEKPPTESMSAGEQTSELLRLGVKEQDIISMTKSERDYRLSGGRTGALVKENKFKYKKQYELSEAGDFKSVERAIDGARKEGANLYFSRSFERSKIFKDLQKQGRISKGRIGGLYRLADNLRTPETNQPQNVAYSLRLDALAAGRKGTPEARKSVVDMLQNNIDKVFDRIRQTPLGGFLQAKNRFTSKTANTEYVPTIRRADNHRNRLMGQWLERANALGINAKMSESDGIKLSYAIEKGNSPEINKFLRELHDYATSESVGMKLGKVENYFPRVLKKEIAEKLFDDVIELQKEIATVPATDANNAVANALKSKSKYVQDAVAAVMSENPGTSYTQALKFLNSQTQNRLFNRSGFEFKRKLKLPADFYERDARKVIPEYIVDLSSRVAQSKFFGQDGEKAMAMINKIGAESPKERRIAHELFQQWSGTIKSDPSRVYSGNTRAFLNAYTNYEVLTKIGLGTATVANAWQPLISFIPKHGAWRSVRAAMDLATDADYRAKIRRSGAIDQDVIHALLGMQPEGALAKLTDKVTTYSGFRPINRLWQYWSAATMDKAVTDWHRIAQGKGARAEWAQKNLKDFDIDWRKPVSEDARLEAMSRFANESQLQKNYLNDPLIFNDPKFAPLFLFKRFGYRQGAYLKDMLWEEVKRGNAAPILRLGAGGALGGALAIGSFNAIQSALSGQPVPDKSDSWFGEAVDMTAAIGMVGIYSDIARMWDMQDKSKIARRVALPVGWGDVEKIAQAATDVDRDWQTYGDAWLVTKRNTHHLANIPGGMIAQVSSRLLTDKQKADKLKYAHTQQKNRVMKLIVEGNGSQAASVIREWNARANEAPLTRDDINSKELREYMERKLTQLAEAKGYDKKTKEGREYLRGQRKAMLQQYKLSRQNLPPRQEMPR